jgi:endonuclease YncB( thermonuclease family)
MYEYNGIIERVVDGDTVVINFDLGFDVWRKQKVRLARINCPEIKTEEGKAAKAFTEKFLNAPVIIKTSKTNVDIYGRYIGEVILSSLDKKASQNAGTVNLNDELVKAGYAKYAKY